jgi:hypothetical protein
MCYFIYAKGSLKEQCHEICGFHYVQFLMCKRKFKGTVPWDFRLQVFSCFSFSQAPEYPIRAIFKFFFFAEIFAAQGAPQVSLAPGANLPTVSLIPVANSHCCHWHRRQICHRCSWHHRQIPHRCHWYQWCTWTCEYLQAEFLEKFETTLILFSGAWKKRIHGEKKTWSKKSRDTVPFKQNISAHRNAMILPHKTLLYKNTLSLSWDYPFKSRVNGFLKRNNTRINFLI